VLYEKIDAPRIIVPQNAQNPVYDTTSRQADKDLKKSLRENGCEIMSSIKIDKDSDNTTLPYRERAHTIKSDHCVQIKHPVYQHITVVTKDKRKEEQPTCNISQRSKKE